MQEYTNYKEQSNVFFDKLLSEATDEHSAIGNSKASHEKRFHKVSEIGDLTGKRILDVGCGLGGYYSFLKEKGVDFFYEGFDINEKMLEGARLKNPEIKEHFKNIDIIQNPVADVYDYAFSIGPLNLFMEGDANYEFTFRLMESLFKCSRIGFALSMTSTLSKKKNKETFYYEPERIIKHITSYCNNYRLDHSYLPHDFTVFCYKEDFYTPIK